MTKGSTGSGEQIGEPYFNAPVARFMGLSVYAKLWLRIWEQLYNPDFKPTEFEGFRMQAGLNAFTLSPKKWIEATNAIGIIAKSGYSNFLQKCLKAHAA